MNGWLQRRRDDADAAVIVAMEPRPSHLSPLWHYPSDIKLVSGLRWARLWPALRRLEEQGQIEARWEDLYPGRKHQRRMYRLRSQVHNPASRTTPAQNT